MFDMLLAERDIRSLYLCTTINRQWRELIIAKYDKYFNNYWNVATTAVYIPERCRILQDSILDLLLVRCGIAPHQRDISNMVSESSLYRIDSLEDLNMTLCLDELIPDETEGQTYVFKTKNEMHVVINEILTWLRDSLYVDLFGVIDKIRLSGEYDADVHVWTLIEDTLDDFYYYLMDISGADRTKWSKEYEQYTNVDKVGAEKITYLLNKFKVIYSLLDIFGSW